MKQNMHIVYILKRQMQSVVKTKNKTDCSQHSCTNVFTAVADLQVQCL